MKPLCTYVCVNVRVWKKGKQDFKGRQSCQQVQVVSQQDLIWRSSMRLVYSRGVEW